MRYSARKARSFLQRRSCRCTVLLGVLLGAFVLACVNFFVPPGPITAKLPWQILQAYHDYQSALAYRPPAHAEPRGYSLDGGTWTFKGDGYSLTVWHELDVLDGQTIVKYGPSLHMDFLGPNHQGFSNTKAYDPGELRRKESSGWNNLWNREPAIACRHCTLSIAVLVSGGIVLFALALFFRRCRKLSVPRAGGDAGVCETRAPS